ATVITTVNPLADLGIGQTGPGTGLAGSNITYTLRVTNYGPSAASGTVVSEAVPPGASYVTATTSQGTVAANNGVVTWTLGNIISNGIANLTVTFNPTVEGTFSNTATVTNSAATDLVTANNSASVTTTIGPAADLGVSQAVLP